MEIVGRLTANAALKELKEGKKVVNFSVAINDRIKTSTGERKDFTTFVNCSYWINPGITTHLVKGMLVELNGRLSAHAWTNSEGQTKAGIDFHVNTIKLHGVAGVQKQSGQSQEKQPITENNQPGQDDLPF